MNRYMRTASKAIAALLLSELVEAREKASQDSLFSEMVYTDDDFFGLFEDLEAECKGPSLVKCQVRPVTKENISDYLLDVDQCLLTNTCLSYHQTLAFKHKKNGGKINTQIVYGGLPSRIEQPSFLGESYPIIDDLQLAEINYQCIVAALPEKTQEKRKNTLTYCLGHLQELFEKGEFYQAVKTTFVTQDSSYSWQMIVIFCSVFGVITISIVCMCIFLKKTDKNK